MIVAVEEALEASADGTGSQKDLETIEKLKENLTMEFTESAGKDCMFAFIFNELQWFYRNFEF